MSGALAHRHEDPAGAADDALRLALEEARLIAAQARLLALNAAFASAEGRRETGIAPEMDALGEDAGRAAAAADDIAHAVDALLRQIASAASLPR